MKHSGYWTQPNPDVRPALWQFVTNAATILAYRDDETALWRWKIVGGRMGRGQFGSEWKAKAMAMRYALRRWPQATIEAMTAGMAP